MATEMKNDNENQVRVKDYKDYDGLMKCWEQIDKLFYPTEQPEKKTKCCLCKKYLIPSKGNFFGRNNPAPLRKSGECCDRCNHEKVIPARMGRSFKQNTYEEECLTRKIMNISRFPECQKDWNSRMYPPPEYEERIKEVLERWCELVILERGMLPKIDSTPSFSIAFLHWVPCFTTLGWGRNNPPSFHSYDFPYRLGGWIDTFGVNPLRPKEDD